MNNSKILKDYLRAVMDSELNCYTYDCAIDRFEREKRKYERKPTVNRPSLQSTEWASIGECFPAFIFFTVAAFIAWGIFLILFGESVLNPRVISADFAIFLVFGVPIISGIVGVVVVNYREISAAKEHNENEMRKYNKNCEIAEQQIKEDAVRIQRLSSQINQLVYGRSMAYKQREKLYNLNIIHHDYRELTKISKMYEYLDIGICYELEGGLGAYAKCREEMIWGSLYDLLVDIKNDLSELKGICYSLYDGITESNRKMNYLCEGMNETLRLAARTEQNTAIAAYNSEISANENRIQTNMMIYSELIR